MGIRKAVAVLIVLLMFALPIASLLSAAHPEVLRVMAGRSLVACALLLMCMNLHLALRPVLYRKRHGSMDGYRYSSGIPAVGNVLALLGVAAAFGDRPAAIGALVTFIGDIGGIPWFVAAVWRDRSFWQSGRAGDGIDRNHRAGLRDPQQGDAEDDHPEGQ